MTSVALEFPGEDGDESVGRRRTTDEILAEPAVKQKRDKELPAQLVKAAARYEAQARLIIEGE
jgi:hypothetical protein